MTQSSNPQAKNNAPDGGDQEIDLREYLGILMDGWPAIVGVAVLGLLIAAYSAWSKPPVYQASALMQVETGGNMAPQSLMEQSAQAQGLGGESKVTAEGAILKSRSVISDAVAENNLGIRVSPKYMPLIGEQIARLHTAFGSGQWSVPFAPAAYAWGNESVNVTQFQLPDGVSSAGLTVEAAADEKNAFDVLTADGSVAGRGQIGRSTTVDYPGIGTLRLFIRDVNAVPGTHFAVSALSMPAAVGSLQSRLKVTEEPQGSGLLQLELVAGSPADAEEQLNAIMKAYLQQSVERQSQQAQQRLSFLEKQLPQLKKERDDAQAKLAEYQSRTGTLDLSAQAQATLDQLTNLDEQIATVELDRQQLLQEYTPKAPQVQAANEKKQSLQRRRDELQGELKELPSSESEFLELKRNVQVADELYTSLLNTAQGLQVSKAGITGVTHIIDSAYAPSGKVAPSRLFIMLVGLLLGAVVGALGVLTWALLRQTLENPDTVEKEYGLSVYVTVPFSSQEAAYRAGRQREKHLLAIDHPTDVAVESLRSFRTSLQFADLSGGARTVGITGPTPSCGKSFVSANLAALLAQSGHTVLLVDADLRKGVLNQTLGLSQGPGLSEILAGSSGVDGPAQRYGSEVAFDVVTTGKRPPNPSELLLKANLGAFAEEAAQMYDYVIFDLPPVLNVTDANIVATKLAATFLTVRSDHSTGSEVEQSIRRFERDGLKFSGAVFNGLRVNRRRYGYGKYGYYAYKY